MVNVFGKPKINIDEDQNARQKIVNTQLHRAGLGASRKPSWMQIGKGKKGGVPTSKGGRQGYR
jgi:hypothetical protein